MDWKDALASRIRTAREEAGLKQSQLCKLVPNNKGKPMNDQTISNYEHKKSQPQLETLDKICEATGKPMSYFFPKLTEEVEPEPMTLSVTERGLVEEFRRLAPDLQRILLETLAAFTKASH